MENLLYFSLVVVLIIILGIVTGKIKKAGFNLLKSLGFNIEGSDNGETDQDPPPDNPSPPSSPPPIQIGTLNINYPKEDYEASLKNQIKEEILKELKEVKSSDIEKRAFLETR